MKRNQVVRKVGDIVFVVQNDQTPSDAEWNEFLDILRSRADLARVKVFVRTAGGAPDAGQRKDLETTLNGVRFRVAVVSDSVKVRFIASVIALFHRDHRSFGVTQTKEAYNHLQLTPQERVLAASTVRELLHLLE